MTDTITIKHIDGTYWTSGSRGKPPRWVSDHPDYIAFKANKVNIVPKEIIVPSVAQRKFWKLIGLEDFEIKVGCYVAADSRVEAIRELNKTFRNPVSSMEMDAMWTEIEPTEQMPQDVGVYQFKEGVWKKR